MNIFYEVVHNLRPNKFKLLFDEMNKNPVYMGNKKVASSINIEIKLPPKKRLTLGANQIPILYLLHINV